MRRSQSLAAGVLLIALVVAILSPSRTNAANVGLLAHLRFDDISVYRLAVAGSYAYVSDNRGGLRVIDIGQPSQPTPVGTYTPDVATPGPAFELSIAVRGKYAYLALGTAGLRIIDISDPTQPKAVGSYVDSTGAGVYGVSVSGDRIFLTQYHAGIDDNPLGLMILDASDPSSPKPLGSHRVLNPRQVVVNGQYAYVSHEGQQHFRPYGGLNIFDVSNPISPTLVGTYDTETFLPQSHLTLSSHYAFLSRDWNGLDIVDVANPVSPTRVANLITVGDVGVSGYLAQGFVGNSVRAYDVSDARSPREIGALDIPTDELRLSKIEVSGPLALIAAGGDGLFITRFTGAVTPTCPPSPSPAAATPTALPNTTGLTLTRYLPFVTRDACMP